MYLFFKCVFDHNHHAKAEKLTHIKQEMNWNEINGMNGTPDSKHTSYHHFFFLDIHWHLVHIQTTLPEHMKFQFVWSRENLLTETTWEPLVAMKGSNVFSDLIVFFKNLVKFKYRTGLKENWHTGKCTVWSWNLHPTERMHHDLYKYPIFSYTTTILNSL